MSTRIQPTYDSPVWARKRRAPQPQVAPEEKKVEEVTKKSLNPNKDAQYVKIRNRFYSTLAPLSVSITSKQ